VDEHPRLLRNPVGVPPVSDPGSIGESGGSPTDSPGDESRPTAARGWVYAIGRIAPQFPNLGVEKEYAQLAGGAAAQPQGMVETDELIEVLRRPDSAYLARQLCWMFSAGDVEAFTLVCQDDAQAHRLVEALPNAEQAEQTVQVVVGTMGFTGTDDPCAGSGLPAVRVDHHLAFQVDEFIDALAAEDRESEEDQGQEPDESFRAAARDLFARLTRRSNNRGIAEEHRALNYVALRYPPLYRVRADAYRDNKTLIDVEARHSHSSNRRLVAVRLTFRDRRTDVVERYQCLVDVTDRFPFLAAPLTQVYD
jgi:PatG C-terminal